MDVSFPRRWGAVFEPLIELSISGVSTVKTGLPCADIARGFENDDQKLPATFPRSFELLRKQKACSF